MKTIMLMCLCVVAACAVERDQVTSETSSASEVTEMLADRTEAVMLGSVAPELSCPIGPRGTCGTGGTPVSCEVVVGWAGCCVNLTPDTYVCCTQSPREADATCRTLTEAQFCEENPTDC